MTLFLATILTQSRITVVSMYDPTVKTNPHSSARSPMSDTPVCNVDTGLNYSTIQEAIDAPETLDGHTIRVDAGNYTENVDMHKSLSIFGAGVANAVIYAYDPNDQVFCVTANNVTIQGFMITGATGAGKYGVYLDGVDNCKISDNFVIDNDAGIFLWGSNDNTISGNRITNISPYTGLGIAVLDYSCDNRIMNNHLSFNHYGIGVHNGSSYNLISGNFVNSSDVDGIRLNWLGAGFAPVTFNNITNNIICNNDYDGILMDEPANNNSVYNNLIHGNYYGIRARDDCTHYNTITHNTVISNTYGIRLESTHSNLICDNFFNNSNNAWDNGVNFWNTGKQAGLNIIGGPYIGGNYWSDNPNPSDTDGDGIGDVPYEVLGNTNTDYLPLVTGLPIFIASFMRPEGEPYPFDVLTISNGTWRREFLNRTHIVTQVPCNASYQLLSKMDGWEMSDRFELSMLWGEIREFKFYLRSPGELPSLTDLTEPVPFVFFVEKGANLAFSYTYFPGNMTLNIKIDIAKDTYASLTVPQVIIGPLNQTLKLALTELQLINGQQGVLNKSKKDRHFDWLKCTIPYHKWYCTYYVYGGFTIVGPSSSEILCVFEEIEPTLGQLNIADVLHSDRLFRFEATLTSVEDPSVSYTAVDDAPTPSFYNIPSGSYMLAVHPYDILSGVYPTPLPLTLPVTIVPGDRANQSQGLIGHPWIPPELDDAVYTAKIVAEFVFSESKLDYLHNPTLKRISVNTTQRSPCPQYIGFVLPRDQMVKTLTAYSDNTTYQLSKFYNYTCNLAGDYNIITVRIPPEMDGLNLTYTIQGDIDGDYDVDLYDAVRLLTHYGAKMGSPAYDAECDLNCDGRIDLYDAVMLLVNYGKKDP